MPHAEAILKFTPAPKPHMRINKAILAVSLLLSGPLLPTIGFAQEDRPSWSYSGENGPNSWGRLDSTFAICSLGRGQSPIDIKDARKSNLPELRFDYKSVPLNIIDTGHSVQVNYAPGSTLNVGNDTYVLKQFHFHHPSEERVNGRSYDMVVHLVHTDAEGRLGVVAVFLQKGDANSAIDLVWRNIPKEKEKAVAVPGITLNAKDLLPANHGYYTFSGSLTTPPCSEGVTWFVMKDPVTVSEAQVKSFAALYPFNVRPIQPANGRQILETR